jgi:dienelactone hydrolase
MTDPTCFCDDPVHAAPIHPWPRWIVATVVLICVALAAVTVWLIWAQEPGRAQTAPTPGVGYLHVDLVDDPCPATNPGCTDHRNQKVPIDWFYPVNDTAGLTPGIFQFGDGAGTTYGSHQMPGVHAGGNNRIPGANPIIVFSHGTGGHGIQNYTMYRDLAAKGYIVAAPTHRGNSLIDTGLGITPDGFSATITKRNLDMKFAVTMTDLIFGSGGKVKRVGSDPVAVSMGHSLGAMIAITQPTGLNPYLHPDARIDAVVGISSSIYLMDVAGIPTANLLASLHKPVLLISQRNDGITPNQFTDRVANELTGTPWTDRLDIAGAEHNATTDVMALKPDVDASTIPQPAKDAITGITDQICADGTTACVDTVHRLQVDATLDFLDRSLT